jgi:hypothetical protein
MLIQNVNNMVMYAGRRKIKKTINCLLLEKPKVTF